MLETEILGAGSEGRSANPVVALVGRPNVGKSTIFNRLCGARDALVADLAGLTRDRRYGRATLAERPATLIDTGGLTHEVGNVLEQMSNQALQAIAEADLVAFVVDAREGLTESDWDIARDLRKRGKAVIVAVNKIDGVSAAAVHEFAAMGFGDCCPISATHGRGFAEFARTVAERLPASSAESESPLPGIRVAVVGRPNVGKSTLINRLLGEQRQVVDSEPGTTRDAIDIPFGDYLLIDTAGVRRRGRVEAGPKMQRTVEKFSIVKTLAALERAQVAVVVVDAQEGVVEQDLHVLDYAIDAGAGVVLAVNKWDGQGRPDASPRFRRTTPVIRAVDSAALHLRPLRARRQVALGQRLEGLSRGRLRRADGRTQPDPRRGHDGSPAAHGSRTRHQAEVCPQGR